MLYDARFSPPRRLSIELPGHAAGVRRLSNWFDGATYRTDDSESAQVEHSHVSAARVALV